jgi:alkanesulfonate monooxygenase SsuD/methylene tetrahydromethanopterin reductase-like flavin-dependent oxidoreductase (luciferase family)
VKQVDIGTVGMWFVLDAMTESIEFAQKIEKLGYNTLQIPEGFGRETFAHAAQLLAHTKRLIIATGIANIWARDPMTMAAATNTVAEGSGGRLLLGKRRQSQADRG